MSAVERRWYIDRIEGDVAVLLDERGVSHEVARALLPDDAREGSRILVSIAPADSDHARLRRALAKEDDGGDIEL